jgi:hypothetical protein
MACRRRPKAVTEQTDFIVPDFDFDFRLPRSAILEFASDGEAARWARECAWIPGTGHCHNEFCNRECLFHLQRQSEAHRVAASRTIRRTASRQAAAAGSRGRARAGSRG